ncbi:hypothetical protein BDF19DRAFT_417121 [Syncephalis fuscata]|nr:hypothetical protein BDF19DRAFT_417121 [Syncephalis fuscata]
MLPSLHVGLIRPLTQQAVKLPRAMAGVVVPLVRLRSDFANYVLPTVNNQTNATSAPASNSPGFSYMANTVNTSPVTSRLAARTAGRSVPVTYDNPGQAYRQLSMLLARNKIRKLLRKRERYEKPTQRRQREKKEREMRAFQRHVSHKVHLVKQMKDRGM